MKRLKNAGTRLGAIALSGMAAFGLARSANAQLVQNGNFGVSGGVGQIGYNTSVGDWSVPAPPGSYNFLFTASTIGGVNGEYGSVGLYGPISSVPPGGNFVALDGNFQQGALSQTISGLTPGDDYTVGFYWCGVPRCFVGREM